MSVSRRSVIAIITGLFATLMGKATAAPAATQEKSVMTAELAAVIEQSRAAHAALMRGDVDGYRKRITLTPDFTLMSPFGGKPTLGHEVTREKMDAMARFFRNGSFEQEVVETYCSTGMIVLVTIERQHVEVGDLPAQDWPLRVTLVFRREGTEWQLAHRHADPLVPGISVAQAAALARGQGS